MHIEITYNNQNPWLYYQYSCYVFNRIKQIVYEVSHRESLHYLIREDAIKNCSLIKWQLFSSSSHINLLHYINHCLQLVKVNGTYIIRIDPSLRIPGTFTKVLTLIRVLEYGTDKIPEYPLFRRIFTIYQSKLNELFVDYLKERFFF